jgi:signal transduction histidine kinase/tetratricopeptide (TPR) repeat protein
MVPPALFTDRNLFALVSCRGSSLSIERGSSDGSCLIYVWFSDIAGHRFGDYQDAFRFAQLGYELVEKRGLKRFQASTYVSFAGMIMPWMKRLADCRNVQERAFEIASRNGDLTYAVYARVGLITQLTVAGEPLHAVQSEAEKGLDFARKAKFAFGIDTINRVLGFIRTLRGSTTHFGSFDHAGFDEKAFDRHLDHHPPMNQFWHWVRKLQVHFLVGDFASAIEASLKARPLLWASPTFEIADYELYSALSRAALWDSASSDQRREHLDALSGHYQRLATWAESCPENFQDRATLVAAEIARIEGRSLAAIELYEQSIRSARGNGFVHNEALAHEVAAQFYAARGFETFADAYLRNARNCYDRWGAQGKVKQLDERYPRLREGRTPAPSSTISAPFGQLDVEAVVRASQAISSEMVLPRLIEKLLRIAVEHAGAERGLLILIRGGDRGGEPRIEAEAITGPGKVEVVVRHAAVRPSDLLQSALHYVIRTRERVLLDDASSDELYSKDDYVRRKHSRSVLCLPIIKQTKLVGALYLENALTPSAFTPDRVTVLQLLASQAAISLENVGLFSDLRQAQDDLARVHRVTTMGELAASLAHELSQPISGAMTNANTCLRKLGRDDPDLDEVRTATRRIVRDAQRATDIIGRIRSQFKKGALNQEVVDVNEINRETVALLRDEAGRYNISVHTELAIDLPQMVGDRVQLQQVSMNLIVNSIEAMKDKDGIREIIIKSQRDEDEWILVSVSDSGVGFPQQLAEQIFDPFFTTKPRGTGMGLRICRSIIESHRGRLWAVGTPGRGATFYLRLPAAPRVPQSLTNSRL